MCTVTLQRLRDSVTQIYTFIIIIIIIIGAAAVNSPFGAALVLSIEECEWREGGQR